ncbi:hypothetical protein [Rhizobium leguminosarum]|uniref:hypothetical protein n=1 Tax=Rhizobium leguminosarum TaxID=384 RepID=UPI000378413B|nr:hypothetical protein [Rhizobium leguminosarum]
MRDKIAVYVMPTDLRREGGDLILAATLALRPMAEQGGEEIERWPSFVKEIFDAASGPNSVGRVVATARASYAAPPVMATAIKSLFSSRYTKTGLGKDPIAKISEIWNELLKDANGSFAGLRNVLGAAANAENFDEIKRPPQKDSSGKPVVAIDAAPDILSVPRNDLSHLLTMQRAKRIVDSAVAKPGQLIKAGLDTGEGSWFHRPWARPATRMERLALAASTTQSWGRGNAGFAPDGTPVRFAAVTAPVLNYDPFRYAPELTEDQKKKGLLSVKTELQKQRSDLDGQLKAKLAPTRTNVDSLVKATSDLSGADPKSALAQIKDARGERRLGLAGAIKHIEDGDLQSQLDDRLALHVASTLEDYGIAPDACQFDADRAVLAGETARHKWFSLQGLPALQRMLHLSIDVEMSFREAEFPVESVPGVLGGFVEIGVKIDDGPVLYTLAKALIPQLPDSHGKCWPATVEERLEASSSPPTTPDELRSRATIDQFDGVVDLEAYVGEGAGKTARFDIDCLDVIAAAESETKRHAAINHVMQSLAAKTPANLDPQNNDVQCVCGQLVLSADDPAREALDMACADRKFRTAGLRIVDQWRDSVAVKEFIRAHGAFDPKVGLDGQLVDADDLTVGFKLDVAVTDRATGERAWSSLTDRHVSYRFPKDGYKLPDGVTLDGLIDVFVGGAGKKETQARRRLLDGVTLNMPTRLLVNQDNSGTAFSEPILSTWEGDPLSLECREDASGGSRSDLPLEITFDLDREGDRPHRLRLGAAYWFGARAAMMAGHARPIASAADYYERGPTSAGMGMALPASTSEVRRYLRFEWIDHPLLATPWSEIQKEFSDRGGLDGGSMVVRSTPKVGAAEEDEDARRFGPDLARRVLFAPAVDLTFAHLHGVFDSVVLKDEGSPLPTGMKGTAYDARQGGFPSFAPGAPVEEASIRSVNKDSDDNPLQSGLAVFRPAGKDFVSGGGYYPDPSARHMVIAIRRGGRNGPYLEGDPIVVDLYPDAPASGPETPGYPDAVPVVITVRADQSVPVGGALAYDALLKRIGRNSWPKRIGLDFAPKAAGPAQEIELRLAAGEDLDLEMWCVPGMAHLAAWFDAPESVALLGAAGKGASSSAEAVAAVRALLSTNENADLPTDSGFAMRRSETVVAAAAVREAARLLHQAMLKKPVLGIAALRRIRAVHAVEMPAQAPQIRVEEGNEWPLRVRRIIDGERLGLLADTAWRQNWLRTSDTEGGVELVVAGAFTIDQQTTETLELHFSAVAPRSRPIDDPQLGRTDESRIRGTWGGPPDPSVKVPSERLYGFRVDKDGSVTLKREEVVFANWRMGAPDEMQSGEVELLSLELARVGKPEEPKGKSVDRYFADGTARRLFAQVACTSRTARLIPERQIYPDTSQILRDRQRQIAANPLPESVILRATVRPLAVPPKSLLPAFSWKPSDPDKDGKIRAIDRRTRIRIRVDRPWFTSGEDERLGIVLWPPNILAARPQVSSGIASFFGAAGTQWSDSALGQGRIARAEPLSKKSDALINLVDQNATSPADWPWRSEYFTDADLGPGGEFITRWGSDPIHETGSLTWFMHAGAFKDLDDWRPTAIDSIQSEPEDSGRLWPEEDRYKPRLVENVLMPIPENEGKHEADAGSAARDTKFMLVSLITYAPRFDVDMEQWYVDVEIDPGVGPDPFLRLGLVRFQPHANRRMQVSFPTAEWTQIPGFKRRVSIEVDDKGKTVTLHSDVPQLARTRKDTPRTILRASLIERHETESGLIAERITRRSDPDGGGAVPYVIVVPADPVASDSVLATFKLPDVPPERKVSFAVLLEEAYVMPKASFEDEPRVDVPDADLGTGDPSSWQESGPRFAVRLEV